MDENQIEETEDYSVLEGHAKLYATAFAVGVFISLGMQATTASVPAITGKLKSLREARALKKATKTEK